MAFGALSDDSLAHTLGSWEVRSRHGGLLCSLPAASDVTTAHTPIWGRGRCIPLLVSERRRGYPVGRIEPCGGDGPVCCFGMFRVRVGWQWLGVFYISPRDDSHGQRLWPVAHWCSWWLVLMRDGIAAFSVAGPAMSTFCWAAH